MATKTPQTPKFTPLNPRPPLSDLGQFFKNMDDQTVEYNKLLDKYFPLPKEPGKKRGGKVRAKAKSKAKPNW